MSCSSAHSQRVILLLRALKTFLRAFSQKMPSGTNFRSRDEALRGRSHMCRSLFGNTGLALSAQCLEKSSATEVQLSTRASASTLRSVKVSVGLTPLASQQGSSDMATSNWRLYHGLLRRGDVSRGSSTESAKVTLLQGGDASEASATESARATLLQSRDASIQLLKKNH